MYYLFYIIFVIVAVILDLVLSELLMANGQIGVMGKYGIVYPLFVLANVVPFWSVLVRRLHDVGKSGWWIFIALIPLIGWIWQFVLTVIDGQPCENRYGPNPKDL